MPPKSKTDTEPAELAAAPEHAKVLCPLCGAHPLDPSTTVFSCEHGTWVFAGTPAPTEEEARATLLAGLDVETLTALLAEKTAAAEPPTK